MAFNVSIGQYFPGDSVVHRIDPRIKVLLTIAYISIVFFCGSFTGFLVLALFVVMVAAISKIRPAYLLRTLKPILMIVVLTFILNIFFNKGTTALFSWWVITITAEGLYAATFLSVRLILWVVGASLMTLTTSPLALTDAVERLLKPLSYIRIPVHELAMMMSIALRFIPTLMEETDKIMKAQMARGADFESGNLLNRAKAMVPLLVPLFVSAFRRADDLAMAMESRCYHGGKGRTRMKILRLTKVDLFASLITAAMCALVLLSRWLP